ncbi:regulatory protein [Cryobacterium sp. MP_M5]|uniref:regulatory protein RecX n=1 Tax=unclassified Cryobacterium TaxID=2649013 RepID=UPI0018CB79F7|nr:MULTISPECIES: regulatory protein RecX [unclassified Cryobacterium]MBG6057459.1 regulatory protein [Cryobacterium sp. MP_M3]MEC5175658.1 regulatory protein [Cryobacterium sp. MP_M5]
MVHFEPADEVTPISAARAKSKARAAAKALSAEPAAEDSTAGTPALAPVTYLRGAAPTGSATPAPHEAHEEDEDAPAAASSATAEADAAAEREHAEQMLLQRLRARSLSATEARTVLAGTEIAEHEIDEVIDRFAELGYIDEAKLADQILHSHHERKGLGRSGVQAEMRRRGLDHDLILDKLEELPDDEAERAIELACKRVQQLGRLDDQTVDRRLTGFLMRKGYASSAVRLAVKAALASRSGSGGASRVRFR